MIPRNPRTRATPFALALLIPSLLGGCFSDDATSPPKAPLDPANPFRATAIRVHPLTQIVPGSDGSPEIICHLELLDRWGDSTKSLGDLTIRLFGPKPGSAGDVEVSRWDLDLTNLDDNAALFDPATRTYRLQLAGGPAWLAGFVAGTQPGTVRRIILQASLSSLGRTLTDDYVIDRR